MEDYQSCCHGIKGEGEETRVVELVPEQGALS
jgi:hypothetical protein